MKKKVENSSNTMQKAREKRNESYAMEKLKEKYNRFG